MKMEPQEQPLTAGELQGRAQPLSEIQPNDKNEHLFTKVTLLESRLSHLTSSNTELSSMLVQSQEEKVKLSKELVEEKMRNNKMMEEFEVEFLNLKDKILNRGSVITQLEIERDKLKCDLQAAEARLTVGQKSGRDLTQEYTHLKDSYQTLIQAHSKELAHNEELSAELLALAQAQDALRRQLEEQQQSVQTTTQNLHTEMDRVRTIVSRMSRDRVKPEDLAALDKEQKTLEEILLGNQGEMKTMLENMKKTYEQQQKKLEEKVAALDKERKENKKEILNTQQKMSQQSTALAYSQSEVKEIEEANSQLQLKIKQLNEEYRARLMCYIQDLAEYMDGLGELKMSPEKGKMKRFVDSMLQEMHSSYRVREEQLASAVRVYKKRLQRITANHHALLIAYRVQREQILSKPELGLNAGPPEANFSLDVGELQSEMEKELQRLRQDKARLEVQLQTALGQVAALQLPMQAVSQDPSQICAESWADIRKQLKDITESTLAGFEKERVLLMTRATVAEAQVSELQEYMENHLGRCEKKTTNLSGRDGTDEA